MAQAGITVNLDIKEIKKILCKKCRMKLRKLVNDRVLEQLAGKFTDEILGDKES